MAENYVCNGAKIECQLCTKPEGTLTVTSNQIKVQGKLFATAKDKGKPNLTFQGNCKKSPYQASPCAGVIAPIEWQGVADLKVQGAPALLESSTIMCGYGGIPIKITDHLQVNQPTEIQPTDAPVIEPVEDATIASVEWMDNKVTDDNKGVKNLHRHDKTNNAVTEEFVEEKLWMDITTQNILPGQQVSITLEDENDPDSAPITLKAFVDDKGKASVLANSKPHGEIARETPAREVPAQQEADNPVQPVVTGEFTKGWWSIDEAGECSITRAVPGMQVYFCIETTIPDGEQVHIALYEDDNNEKEETGTGDKDDRIGLVSASGDYLDRWTVTNGKVVANIRLANMPNQLAAEADKQLELYFRCSYGDEHVELPHSPKDYLVVSTLVIDRYKVPGLNGEGIDIADDLTYGTGYPQGENIYTSEQVRQYIEEYKNNGFDEEKHTLFTNREDLSVEPLPAAKTSAEVPSPQPAKDRFSLIIEETTVKRDNTTVATPRHKDISRPIPKYPKAKYSRNQCYGAQYKYKKRIDVPFTDEWDFDISIDVNTGEDIKEMNEGKSPITGKWRDDDYLFWNFRNTAALYFARGDLQGNLNRMIAKFKSNTGGIYEDIVLTRHVENHTVTKSYCTHIENYIAEKIKQETFDNIAGIEDKEPDFENEIDKRIKKQKIKGKDIIDDESNELIPITRPAYSVENMGKIGASKGMTIALNDIWATEVILKELKNKGDAYTARYQVTLWDHFGLDVPDIQKNFNIIPSIKEAFACWFVLQHLRGYKPFVTKITFEKAFKGNINEGREERLAQQKRRKRSREKKLEELRRIGRKKPGEM